MARSPIDSSRTVGLTAVGRFEGIAPPPAIQHAASTVYRAFPPRGRFNGAKTAQAQTLAVLARIAPRVWAGRRTTACPSAEFDRECPTPPRLRPGCRRPCLRQALTTERTTPFELWR